jgi:brefeldin A-resistance guanine nucleotide exchange factor 1
MLLLTTRLKELKPEQEINPEALQNNIEVESTVKETVITGVPSQFVSDRNRDRPQTPTFTPTSPPREKRLLQPDPSQHNNRTSSSCMLDSLPILIEDVNKPYGLASIRELLRVLVSLLEPHNRQHTDTMRVMALRIIDVAFEVAGTSIGLNYSLRKLATDDLCRYIFQLVRSDQPLILSNSLRVTSTLLHTMRPYLKLQQELFLSYVVACLQIPKAADQITGMSIDSPILADIPSGPRLSVSPSGRSTPIPVKERQRLGLEGSSRGPDAREVMVECIAGLTARIPTFMIDLFLNYDCEVDLSDLCEDVVGFLSRNAFPDAAGWSTSNVPPLCLNALLAYVGYIADRLDVPSVHLALVFS